MLQNKADCLKGAKQKENGRQFVEEKLNSTGHSHTAQRTTVGKKWKVTDLVHEPFSGKIWKKTAEIGRKCRDIEKHFENQF